MKRIGITGNIGCGKTYVSLVFAKLGIPVYNSDSRAKYLMQHHQELILKLKKYFGKEVYLKDGKINSAYLSELIFNDCEKRNAINQLVHPFVMNDFYEFCDNNKEQRFAMMESAILFETGLYIEFDKTILVYASRKIRIDRIKQRTEISEKEILERMRNQWNYSTQKSLASYIIHNDGKKLILPQVLTIYNDICGKS